MSTPDEVVTIPPLVLTKDARVFKKTGPNSSLLAKTGGWLRKGLSIHLSAATTMTFDHQDQVVVEILRVKDVEVPSGSYIIVSELERDPAWVTPPVWPTKIIVKRTSRGVSVEIWGDPETLTERVTQHRALGDLVATYHEKLGIEIEGLE